MQNFDWEYLQVMEIASRGCRISMRSILTLSKTCDVDAIIHDRQAEKYLQVRRKASRRYVVPNKLDPVSRTQCIFLRSIV